MPGLSRVPDVIETAIVNIIIQIKSTTMTSETKTHEWPGDVATRTVLRSPSHLPLYARSPHAHHGAVKILLFEGQ